MGKISLPVSKSRTNSWIKSGMASRDKPEQLREVDDNETNDTSAMKFGDKKNDSTKQRRNNSVPGDRKLEDEKDIFCPPWIVKTVNYDLNSDAVTCRRMDSYQELEKVVYQYPKNESIWNDFLDMAKIGIKQKHIKRNIHEKVKTANLADVGSNDWDKNDIFFDIFKSANYDRQESTSSMKALEQTFLQLLSSAASKMILSPDADREIFLNVAYMILRYEQKNNRDFVDGLRQPILKELENSEKEFLKIVTLIAVFEIYIRATKPDASIQEYPASSTTNPDLQLPSLHIALSENPLQTCPPWMILRAIGSVNAALVSAAKSRFVMEQYNENWINLASATRKMLHEWAVFASAKAKHIFGENCFKKDKLNPDFFQQEYFAAISNYYRMELICSSVDNLSLEEPSQSVTLISVKKISNKKHGKKSKDVVVDQTTLPGYRGNEEDIEKLLLHIEGGNERNDLGKSKKTGKKAKK